ncbi:hypothetical protein BGZ61DRAFT_229536 [Ilyonectria robusta]|uniref:uncharacterized protein n=1 Tax=Ilyonectria robusta TaxID=1079257 RepID=UPI001E8CC790|nr:uncharacterized protein BGZ61DRAFT_229536 [Ilyonectria robusta]KAH8651712.1 hypothetical protein BGZ61DRAFT_229536 [Ilyonectria robusta]
MFQNSNVPESLQSTSHCRFQLSLCSKSPHRGFGRKGESASGRMPPVHWCYLCQAEETLTGEANYAQFTVLAHFRMHFWMRNVDWGTRLEEIEPRFLRPAPCEAYSVNVQYAQWGLVPLPLPSNNICWPHHRSTPQCGRCCHSDLVTVRVTGMLIFSCAWTRTGEANRSRFAQKSLEERR